MYVRFVERANKWKKIDPEVEMRVQIIGFRRGSNQAEGFARLLHELGIGALHSAIKRVIPDGESVIEYTNYRAFPGESSQTMAPFDLITRDVPVNFDRRLPTFIMSGFQITAADALRIKSAMASSFRWALRKMFVF